MPSPFQALKDASTPDLRWLFDDAAAVLTASSSYRQAVSSSSAGSSPITRPRLASLHGHELAVPSVLSKRDVEAGQTPSLPATLSRVCTPGPSASDTMSIQQQFRERLMEEIKRLLEEIIDSHPEALEAIESVRQAKLARIARRAVTGVDGCGEPDEMRGTASYIGDDDDGYVDTAAMMFDDADVPGPSHRGYGRRRLSEEQHGNQSATKRHGQKSQSADQYTSGGHDAPTDSEEPHVEDPASYGVAARIMKDSMEQLSGRGSLRYSTGRPEGGAENLALAELARQRNVHVARSHDDTSEGAVHYFQVWLLTIRPSVYDFSG